MVVVGVVLCELVFPASRLQLGTSECKAVRRLGLMTRGLAPKGRSMWCVRGRNGAPLARFMYMARINNTYHSRFFTRAIELRVDTSFCPIVKPLLVFLGVFV